MFLKIEDHVNFRTYPLDDVPIVTNKLSKFELLSDVGPIYISYDGETARGRYTIADMVDLYFNKIPFSFVYEGDVLDIAQHLKVYIESIVSKYQNSHVSTQTREQQIILKRVVEFYKYIDKASLRLMNRANGRELKISPFLQKIIEADR